MTIPDGQATTYIWYSVVEFGFADALMYTGQNATQTAQMIIGCSGYCGWTSAAAAAAGGGDNGR